MWRVVSLVLLSPSHLPRTVKGLGGQQWFSCSLKSRCKSGHDFPSTSLSNPERATIYPPWRFLLTVWQLLNYNLSCSGRFFSSLYSSFSSKILQVSIIYIDFFLNLPFGELIPTPRKSGRPASGYIFSKAKSNFRLLWKY